MFSFYLFSVLVFTGIGHSSAQGVSLCVCVCVWFISISLLFGLVCNKRREGYDVILLLLFCWGPNIHFLCSMFYLVSFLVFTGIGHSSAQSVSLCVCVCFLSICFLFGLVLEGYHVILLLFCWGPNIHVLCSIFIFYLFLSLPGSAILLRRL